MRRVRWSTRGLGALSGLSGVAELKNDDVLPVTAALRDLQRLTGLEVTAFGSSGEQAPTPTGSERAGVCSSSRRIYSVRLIDGNRRAAACMLTIQTEGERSAPTDSRLRRRTETTA